jgi:translation initiation factor IF-2
MRLLVLWCAQAITQINRRTELGLFRRVSKAALVAALFFLIACSPKLDWRTVQAPQERYTALFPGKPDKLERKITYQNIELGQTLEAVKIDDDIYSVSTIQLPANQSNSLSKLLSQLQANLIDRAKASGGDVTVEDAFYKTTDRQRLPTKDYFLDLNVDRKSQQVMRVRWINRVALNGDIWVYQISVLHMNAGTENAKNFLSREDYENFFSDFSPE